MVLLFADDEIDVVAGGFVASGGVADECGVFRETSILSIRTLGACPAVGRTSVFPLCGAVGEYFGCFLHGFGFAAPDEKGGDPMAGMGGGGMGGMGMGM